ncbi:hypothetical protein AAFF_G00089390 [Aldrovandia affinis]|uniref:Transcription regulator protein BACH1 n=1 Tax=Aldrovandia affinis TaxID=143900 RepID=A0AAD7RWE2_9TELE|nr:hypothetical protein AAFF_G00089390 [Aldrovandia affinis]
MSQAMPFESPRTSVFTFQSSVHSSHVLRCLDEQRRKEVLCDVTVVVENKSYRAHRSVLASCSDYFHNRVTNHAGQGLVITLPGEVTVEGFDPLLQFAYTSKLLFTKENIVEIHNCAAILGFHNLDKACFDFLLPKFFDSGKSVLEIQRNLCCKSKCNKQKSSQENSCGNLDEDGESEEHANAKPPGTIPENQSDGTQSQCSTSTSEFPEACDPNCAEKQVEEGDRSSVEREVAEHLAKGFWPDPCPSQAEPLLLDPDGQSALGKATDFHWLKQLDLTAGTGDCPFLRDLGEEVQLPECEGVSQLEKSPYISSINSGDDSDSDTDGDSESYNQERAREVQLPFPVGQISSLSRNDFQHMLKLHSLTREQLDFVHDVRRRSKNRIAAQRCRKRKLDCISGLEGEIHKLRGEKEKLMQEREQLKRRKGETLQSLSTLCHKVCSEATLSPDQLEFLAQYSSPDCPASVLMTPTPSPSLSLSLQDLELPAGLSPDTCPSEEPSTDEACPTPQPPSPSAPPPSLPRTAGCPALGRSSPSSSTDICSGSSSQCPTNEGTDSSF